MRILTPDDHEWQEYYERLPRGKRDVFYAPGYAKACRRGLYGQADVLCAAQNTNESIILYPFVERDLGPMIPWSPAAQSLRDATGLYGRGGPVFDKLVEQDVTRFHAELDDYFRARRVITGFDRYHPVIRNERAAGSMTEIRETGRFVVVPLDPDLDTIKAGYKYAQRKSLNKAERAEVQVHIDENLTSLDEFNHVYKETLDRNAARDFYYFESSFYLALRETIPQNIAICYATVKGEIISCELILIEPPFGYSFIGGTLAEHQDKSPNTKLKHEIFRYLKQRGCSHFLLGGGYRPDDGIFRYKLSFAPDHAVPSLIGTTVFDESAYRTLHEEFAMRHNEPPGDRFQFYDAT